ncbi:MAG: ATP-grasp domain-containing protein [Nitrosopumilus sp.]|nr:ATP-grasp domain-containing protein [Nitrosopumilus sp.]
MRQINALVTSVGGIVAQGIIKSLKHHNKYSKNRTYEYNIYGTDIIFDSAGLFRADRFSIINKPKSEDYVDSIINLCSKNNIDIVFVGSDQELPKISINKKLIENDAPAKVLINPHGVIETFRDKYKTFEFLKENNLNYIPSCLDTEYDGFTKEYGFPLIVKPCEGSGSKLLFVVNDNDELDYAVSSIKKIGGRPLIQKYLKNDDQEFTTGITLSKNEKHIMSSIVIKKILKHGQTYKAIIDKFPEIKKVSEDVARKIDGIGALNIQLRIDEDDNNAKIIEINPRFSASCPMRTVAGINEPDIVARNTIFDEYVKITDYQSLLCLRYWNESYLDLGKFNEMKSSKHNIKELKSSIIDYF